MTTTPNDADRRAAERITHTCNPADFTSIVDRRCAIAAIIAEERKQDKEGGPLERMALCLDDEGPIFVDVPPRVVKELSRRTENTKKYWKLSIDQAATIERLTKELDRLREYNAQLLDHNEVAKQVERLKGLLRQALPCVDAIPSKNYGEIELISEISEALQ